MVPFYASSSSSTATNKAESSLRRHWLLRIASESHSSSGRFIPLFPNLDFCCIYQISSPSHNSILSYSVFSSFLNLSHFQLTLFFFFFYFLLFKFETTIVIVSKSGGPMQQQVSILSFISSRQFPGSFFSSLTFVKIRNMHLFFLSMMIA